MKTLASLYLGFTLLEIIFVLFIFSIVSVIGVGSLLVLTQAYMQVEKQSVLQMNSDLALVQMTKKLQAALPSSIRLTNDNRCLQFLPVVSQGFYLHIQADRNNGLDASGYFLPMSVSPHWISDAAYYLSIGALSADELYGNYPASLAPVRTRTITAIQLAEDKQWQRNSIQQQFYLLGRSQAYCVVNETLRYYDDLPVTPNNIDLSLPFDLLAHSVAPLESYYTIPSEMNNCQQCIIITLRFVEDEYVRDISQTVISRYTL